MSIIILCDQESCRFNQPGWESISFKKVCSRYTETGFPPLLYGTEGAGIFCGNEILKSSKIKIRKDRPCNSPYKIKYGTCIKVDKFKGVM